MLNIVLFEPEIPNNTGSIIRLCANMGAKLHLIKPYGFEMDDKKLRRAGLDYRDLMCVVEYENFTNFLTISQANPKRIFCATTKTNVIYTKINYQYEDYLLFGPETRGLPDEIRDVYPCITLPMAANSRSLNLSNSVSIIAYEAWRQLDFVGCSD